MTLDEMGDDVGESEACSETFEHCEIKCREWATFCDFAPFDEINDPLERQIGVIMASDQWTRETLDIIVSSISTTNEVPLPKKLVRMMLRGAARKLELPTFDSA